MRSAIVFALLLATAQPKPFDPKNVLATDKKAYVHILWNAADQKDALTLPSRKLAAARLAVRLAFERYPAGATADRVKVDIVIVNEKDGYGLPKWNALKRVATVELLRSKVLKNGKPVELAEADLALLERCELHG